MHMVIKPKLEETKPHAFEKQVLVREMAKGEPRVSDFYRRAEMSCKDIDLFTLRPSMKRLGEDITTEEIQVINKIIPAGDHMVPVQIYKREDAVGRKKAMLFVHGGGFFGGDVEGKANQCKYLAEQADIVVVSPEYRLAPETPYPGAVCDVMRTLEWMVEASEELGINADKIAISGESAGGTLTGNCCLLDKGRYIKEAFYIYAAVDLVPADKTPYHWDYSLYQIDEEQKDYIMGRLHKFKEVTEIMEQLYIQNGDLARDGRVSPFYAEDFGKHPKTVMINAEFDYFRICDELYAKKLEEAGVDVEIILYEGLDHGFYDRLGALPQTADCIEEIAKRMKEL